MQDPHCGRLADGEPDRCAKGGAGNERGDGKGEPYGYHILNRYFDECRASVATIAASYSDFLARSGALRSPILTSGAVFTNCGRRWLFVIAGAHPILGGQTLLEF